MKLARDLVPQGTTHRSEVSILIGFNYYWNVATSKFHILSDNATAVETIFSWVVQGIYTHTVQLPLNHHCSVFVLHFVWQRWDKSRPLGDVENEL